jgi:hypothetical protein
VSQYRAQQYILGGLWYKELGVALAPLPSYYLHVLVWRMKCAFIYGHFIYDMHMIHDCLNNNTWVYPTKKNMRWFHNEYCITYQVILQIKTFQKVFQGAYFEWNLFSLNSLRRALILDITC